MTTAWVATSALALFCDGCGRRLPGYTFAPRVWPLAWAVAADREWTGHRYLPGPHFCGACTAAADNHARVPGRELRAAIRRTGRTTVVRLAGDLDAGCADRLRTMLAQAGAHAGTLVLDLAGVTQVDSVALAVVATCSQRTRADGGRLLLARPSRYLRAVLRALRPDFPVLADDGTTPVDLRREG